MAARNLVHHLLLQPDVRHVGGERWPKPLVATRRRVSQLVSPPSQITTFSFDIFLKAGIPQDKIRYVTICFGVCEIITSVSCVSTQPRPLQPLEPPLEPPAAAAQIDLYVICHSRFRIYIKTLFFTPSEHQSINQPSFIKHQITNKETEKQLIHQRLATATRKTSPIGRNLDQTPPLGGGLLCFDTVGRFVLMSIRNVQSQL